MKRPGKRLVARLLKLLVVLLVLAGIGFGVQRYRKVQAAATFPLAPARKGEFLVLVRTRGELKARRSVQIITPNVPDLTIVWQATPGGSVKKDEVVIRCDPSSAKQQLQEREATLRQAEATYEQAVAQERITAEQDLRDLSQARYQVERAKLEVSKQEIVSAIQGEESKIELSLSEEKLKVQEATVTLHKASDKAKIASLTRNRDKALAEVNITKRRLEQMELKAPSDGVIMYMSNYSQGWMSARPFKVGDRVFPGTVLAEIPDLSTLEMEGKVDEIDRGRISMGNAAFVKIDSFPEQRMPAKLTFISPLTEQGFEWPPTRSFRAFARMEKPDPRLRPAMNGSLDAIVNRIPDAISVPNKALYTRHGKPIVYVAHNGQYRPVEVEVLARNPDETAIKGVNAGTMVALADVEKETTK
ncbi:MAG: efflux RND transporter periplasmic adaptor subunit [Bryobacteraceae bacterium]